jgi:hypothetical protein
VRGQDGTYHATPGPLLVFLIIPVTSLLFGTIVFVLLGAALIWSLVSVIFAFVAAAVVIRRMIIQRPR